MNHRQPLPSPQRPTAKTIKKMTAVSPLAPRCWYLPSPGGMEDFPSDPPPTLSSTVALAASLDTREQRRRRRTPRPRRLMHFIWSADRDNNLRLSPPLEQQWFREGSPLGMPTSFSGCCCLIRALRSRLWRQRRPSRLGRTPCCPPPPPTPAGCYLGIGHVLLIRNQNVPTTRQKRQSIHTLCPTFSTTTLKMVGDSGSP